jgi:hypothetical protein
MSVNFKKINSVLLLIKLSFVFIFFNFNHALADPSFNVPSSFQLPSGTYTATASNQIQTIVATSNISITGSGNTNNVSVNLQGVGDNISGTNLFRTNIQGVYIQFFLPESKVYLTSSTHTFTLNANQANSTFIVQAQLVLDGPITSGLINNFPSVTLSVIDSNSNASIASQTISIIGSPSIVASSCIINYPSTVYLPIISVSSFSHGNSTAGSTKFSININCPIGSSTPISMYLTDYNLISNTTNLLSLQGNSSLNYGLQIGDPNGNLILFSPSSSTSNIDLRSLLPSIPFTVQYYSATLLIPPGNIQSSMAFTILYP